MIYYPLTTLMLAGIRDILIVTLSTDVERFRRLLRDGAQWGIDIRYETGKRPNGIAQAILVGARFIGDSRCALVLGDSIFYGAGLSAQIQSVAARPDGATIFVHWVQDPERYGVVVMDAAGRPADIVEKPATPRSNWAVTGLYFYDPEVVEITRGLKPSARSEVEIADVNRAYLKAQNLNVEFFGRGFAWLDAGTHDSLLQAAEFVSTIERRQGLKIGCPEEVAYRMGFIDAAGLERLAAELSTNDYGRYLRGILSRPS